jgi:hypothetical protein
MEPLQIRKLEDWYCSVGSLDSAISFRAWMLGGWLGVVFIWLYKRRDGGGMDKDSIGLSEKPGRGVLGRWRLTDSQDSCDCAPSGLLMSASPDYDADPIWSSSRTARQIHDLGRVEKVSCLASAKST